MKEIITSHKFIWRVWVLIIGLIFVIFFKIIIMMIPDKFIWDYTYIIPEKQQYTVWESIRFNAQRFSIWEIPVTYDEYIYCMSNGTRLPVTDSYQTQWKFTRWTIESNFPFGSIENPIMLTNTGSDCHFQSCQTIIYQWVEKSNCFISNPSFDIWEK